mmetsp:Transcript_34859/g.37755  ORF Transcript_34859/g.37755 Transcript_34859/m.37755 type:complete len:112 (+) Transcript_34859:554-889(+)
MTSDGHPGPAVGMNHCGGPGVVKKQQYLLWGPSRLMLVLPRARVVRTVVVSTVVTVRTLGTTVSPPSWMTMHYSNYRTRRRGESIDRWMAPMPGHKYYCSWDERTTIGDRC